MQTNDQKKEAVSKQRSLIGRLWETFIITVSTAVFLTVLVALGLKIYFISESVFNSALECVDVKVEQEQMIYHSDALRILNDVQRDVWLVDEKMKKLEQGVSISTEEKKQLNRDLKKIEESSMLLERNFNEYFNDLSIQVYSRSNKQITSFIYETMNFSLTLNRLVRTSEMVLFLDEELDESQIALVLDNYYDVLWYVDQFGLFE